MIGILPCAGTAARFDGLPKYLLPCPGGYLMQRHIDGMKAAGCKRVMVGARNSIQIGTLNKYSPDTSNYIATNYDTMTQTVLSARDNTHDENILFGMPDTYFECPDVYQYLRNELDRADVALAVCRARPKQHLQGGMVSFSHNQVLEVVDKPEHTRLEYIWGALAWRPVFWDCLKPDMPHVGYGLNVAIERGLNVRAVLCEGNYFDCGSFDRYAEMIRMITA